MKRAIGLPVFLCLVFFLAPFFGLAHGDGASFEKEIGGYLVDIGYSAPEPEAGEAVSFEFGLKNNSKEDMGNDVPFDDVWVKIASEEETIVFASGIYNSKFGGPRLNYVFPKEGTYTISARFESDSGALTEASFSLVVFPAKGGGGIDATYLFGLGGLLIGFLAAFVLLKNKIL